MSSNLIPFHYVTQPIRVHIDNMDAPWWVAQDVCDVLGIADHRQAYERLDADERGGCLIPTLRGTQELICVNEPGLYTLILRSRKAEAKTFKRWITHEVLPQIRRTGKYADAALPETTVATRLEACESAIAQLTADLAATRQALAATAPFRTRLKAQHRSDAPPPVYGELRQRLSSILQRSGVPLTIMGLLSILELPDTPRTRGTLYVAIWRLQKAKVLTKPTLGSYLWAGTPPLRLLEGGNHAGC